MRHVTKLLGTGCFFLCLGGWGYNAQVIGETKDPKVAIEAAVAAAAATPIPAAAPIVVAVPAAPANLAVAEVPVVPVAPAPAATPNLNSAVVNVGADGTVEQFDAPDLDINTALYLLSLQTKRNIIASKDVKGTITAHLHGVTFTEALEAILTPNGFGYIEKGNFIYVYSAKEIDDIRKRDRKTVNRIYRLKYVSAADAQTLIKPMLSTTGQSALTPAATIGIATSATDTGGNAYATDDTLVINDYTDNLNEIEKNLKLLDVRPKQVLIESTILRAILSEDNALGIDFVSLSGIDFGTMTGGSLTNNTYQSFQKGTTDGASPPATPANNLQNANGRVAKSTVGTDFASSVPQGGLSIGFLSNNINVFLRALEQSTDLTVVANPKILALNKHRGEVFIGQQFGYLTTTTSQTTTTQTVQFLDTGTRLIFRPFITDDGYVRMEIHPEDSSGGLNSSNLPEKQSTEVTSNLMIKDGRTVVIGGLFREQSTAARGQVPVLGNIPILGAAFRRTADNTSRNETVVLITPHIINDDTALYEESEKKQEDVSRMMLGNRAGLQPWGRSRLAQTWYAKAQEALEKNDREKALMYTDWALNSNPRFIEAIKLREELTSKKVQEADFASSHDYVRCVINADKAAIPNTGGSGHYPQPAPATTVPATQP